MWPEWRKWLAASVPRARKQHKERTRNMQWFRNRRTATKLQLAFAAMVALMCVLGMEGIRSLQDLNRTTRAMFDHDVLAFAYLKDADLQIMTSGKSLRDAILARNAGDRDKHIGNVIQQRQKFAADLEAFRRLVPVTAMKVTAGAVLEEFAHTSQQQDKVIACIRA